MFKYSSIVHAFEPSILEGVWDSYLRSLGTLPFESSVPAALTLSVFSHRYGEHALHRVLKRYKWSQEELIQDTHFTFGHFFALLVGIGIQVRYRELRLRAWETHGEGTSFRRLSSVEQMAIMRHFRSDALMNNIFRAYYHFPLASNCARLKKDITILKSCKISPSFQHPESSALALSDFLGHELVYKELQAGMIIPVALRPNYLAYMRVEECYYANRANSLPDDPDNSALVAFFLRPLYVDKKADLHVLFRGGAHWKNTQHALESSSSSVHSYCQYERGLLAALARTLPVGVHRTSQHLIIHGHNLGSADSMQFSNSIVQSRAAHIDAGGLGSMCAERLGSIGHITLQLWNSPGIAFEDNTRFLAAFSKAGLAMSIHLHRVIGDDLQQATGEVILGAQAPLEEISRHIHEYRYADVLQTYNPLWRLKSAYAHQTLNNRRPLPAYQHYCESNGAPHIEAIYQNPDFLKFWQKQLKKKKTLKKAP